MADDRTTGMRRRRMAVQEWLCLASVLAACVIPQRAEAESPVVMQLQSKSWIPGSAFDEQGFTESCAAAGVTLVPPRTPGAVATAVVTYAETKGSGFSMFGVGEPVGFGTNILFQLTLLDVKAKTMLKLAAAAETPPGLPKEQFHAGAREAFAASPRYMFACAVIAGALGAREQLAKVLPWAAMDSQGAALLKSLSFRPETDAERAYVAVGGREFSSLPGLGAAALDPLLLLFQNSLAARDGVGTLPALVGENAAVLRRALVPLEALAASDDEERISDVLLTFLNDYTEYRTDVDEAAVVHPVLVDVIRVLGRIGTHFTIPLLEEWERSAPTIALEAKQALAVLRKRLVIQ